MSNDMMDNELYCSFCGKHQDEVKNKIDPDQLLLLSEYKLKSFKNYYISLKKRADTGVDKNYIASILNTAYSFTYLERVSTAPSYEYTNCIKILAGE